MLVTATAPATEPISRAWAKLSARIDSADEDAQGEGAVQRVTGKARRRCKRRARD